VRHEFPLTLHMVLTFVFIRFGGGGLLEITAVTYSVKSALTHRPRSHLASGMVVQIGSPPPPESANISIMLTW